MDPRRLGQDVQMEAAATSPRLGEAGAVARDEAATATPDFRRLFDEHHAFVWRSLLHFGVSSAWVDDAVQEAFVVVHRRLPSYDGVVPMRAWLWGIARNVARNQSRSLGREQRRRDAWSAEQAIGPDAALDRARELRFVHDILLSLDEPLRDALVLSDVEGMTAPEIAAALEVNVNTIYSRLRIARQRFAEIARKRGHAPGGGSDGT